MVKIIGQSLRSRDETTVIAVLAQSHTVTLHYITLHYIRTIYSDLSNVTSRWNSYRMMSDCRISNVSVVGEKLSVTRQTGRLQADCCRAVVQQWKMSDHRQWLVVKGGHWEVWK